MMLTGPFNATRHQQKPLPQPAYNFSHVPRAQSDLEGSSLHHITDRDHFHECMAEMLLLCKEAMRRRPGKPSGGAKPLSLEYLADRLDIDDPCFGYLIRTKEQIGKNDPNLKAGMLQGFITITTFTNWQKSFRWDSFNDAAYSCDSRDHELPCRKRDDDGSLARGLQSTTRCGDINMEGIVWPRIAEISLLGGLGCGKTLINYVIEQLEYQKGTARANYDYVVLQATDNSIPFYEAMGFVRVGAVMLDEVGGNPNRNPRSNEVDEQSESDENPFVTSKVMSYTVKTGETLNRIAAKFEVDVWDVIFLNRDILGDAQPSSKPKLNIVLMIPARDETAASAPVPVATDQVKWHIAKENETPRMIAQLYNVKAFDVVECNKGRLPGLISNSRLKELTRIRVSHFDQPDSEYNAYAHWSFPDSQYEEPEPSYMMARKLNRRRNNPKFPREMESFLKTDVTGYLPPPLLLPPSPMPVRPPAQKFALKSLKNEGAAAPKPPKRPLSAYMLFASEQRELAKSEIVSGEIRELWNELDDSIKAGYVADAKGAMSHYHIQKEKYEQRLEAHLGSDQDNMESQVRLDTQSIKSTLYNKVVRLKPGAMTEGSKYTYWYVLTYIPDLKWCHLAPMVKEGTFGPEKKKAEGKPRWKLVDESLGMEVDISSSYCIPINSRSMRKTLDADREEWDIIDDGSDPTKGASLPPRGNWTRGTSAVKPSVERLRKKSKTLAESPSLLATLPGSGLITSVKLVGKGLFDSSAASESPRKRGRPIGSKNKSPKTKRSSPSKTRKLSVVKFGIGLPASARKAAALRSPDGKRKKSSAMIPQGKKAEISVSAKRKEREISRNSTTESCAAKQVHLSTDRTLAVAPELLFPNKAHRTETKSGTKSAAVPIQSFELENKVDLSTPQVPRTSASESGDLDQLRSSERSVLSNLSSSDPKLDSARQISDSSTVLAGHTEITSTLLDHGEAHSSLILSTPKERTRARRPRRSAAPSFLGDVTPAELKKLPRTKPSARPLRKAVSTSPSKKSSIKLKEVGTTARPRRSAAPSFLGDITPKQLKNVRPLRSKSRSRASVSFTSEKVKPKAEPQVVTEEVSQSKKKSSSRARKAPDTFVAEFSSDYNEHRRPRASVTFNSEKVKPKAEPQVVTEEVSQSKKKTSSRARKAPDTFVAESSSNYNERRKSAPSTIFN